MSFIVSFSSATRTECKEEVCPNRECQLLQPGCEQSWKGVKFDQLALKFLRKCKTVVFGQDWRWICHTNHEWLVLAGTMVRNTFLVSDSQQTRPNEESRFSTCVPKWKVFEANVVSGCTRGLVCDSPMEPLVFGLLDQSWTKQGLNSPTTNMPSSPLMSHPNSLKTQLQASN